MNEFFNLFFVSAKNLKNGIEILNAMSALHGIIMLIVHLLILVVTMTINIPMIGSYLEIGGRFKVAMGCTIAVAFSVVAVSVVMCVLSKVKNETTDYFEIFGLVGVSTVPGTVLILAGFFLGLASPLMWIMILVIAVLAWTINSYVVFKYLFPNDEVSVLWVSLGVHLGINIICFSIIKNMIMDFITSIYNISELGE